MIGGYGAAIEEKRKQEEKAAQNSKPSRTQRIKSAFKNAGRKIKDASKQAYEKASSFAKHAIHKSTSAIKHVVAKAKEHLANAKNKKVEENTSNNPETQAESRRLLELQRQLELQRKVEEARRQEEESKEIVQQRKQALIDTMRSMAAQVNTYIQKKIPKAKRVSHLKVQNPASFNPFFSTNKNIPKHNEMTGSTSSVFENSNVKRNSKRNKIQKRFTLNLPSLFETPKEQNKKQKYEVGGIIGSMPSIFDAFPNSEKPKTSKKSKKPKNIIDSIPVIGPKW